MSPAGQIEIRRAQPDDAAAIAIVLQESFVEFKALYTEAGFDATTLGANQIVARMAEGPVWIAVRDGSMLGTVAAVIKDVSVYIRGMGVIPTARSSEPARDYCSRSNLGLFSEESTIYF